MKKQLMIIGITTALIASSCGGDQAPGEEQKLIEQMNKDTSASISVSQEVLDDMMQTLPSPNEIAHIISKSKSAFKKEMLVPSASVQKYTDKYAQSLGLGAYGVDLGYINLNDKTLYIVEYLENVRTISKELKVEQFFDFNTLSSLAKNKKNTDSLIHISTQNFNQIDRYLREQKRGDLSVLLLVGAWIEGLHMYNEIAAESPGEDIHQRIGEQKVIMDNIMAILEKMQQLEYYAAFKTKLSALKSAFDKVQITYQYNPPTTKEENGQLVVVDNTKTIIKITDEDIKQISEEVKKLRTELLIK